MNGYYDRDGRYQRIRGLGRDRDRLPPQPSLAPPGNDPGGYYSDADHDGYYDRDGRFQRVRYGRRDRDRPLIATTARRRRPLASAARAPITSRAAMKRIAAAATATTGTIFGALAGGLIGGAASHGNGGAVVGGVVWAACWATSSAGDIDCEDQPVPIRIYVDGLNGDIGRPYEWRPRQSRHLHLHARIPPRRPGLPRIHRDHLARRHSFTRTGVGLPRHG